MLRTDAARHDGQPPGESLDLHGLERPTLSRTKSSLVQFPGNLGIILSGLSHHGHDRTGPPVVLIPTGPPFLPRRTLRPGLVGQVLGLTKFEPKGLFL